ncbi:hypothetical protein LEP1GSC036_0595 [Leptospira weilii str. 2006001853]|uniref:Uncharacterized protein n=1 Tax=Leptospira weilii str. 2006001853 TaxID=1001589 RepID=A0A828Z153_9LEPT|nr:hypothetical protein LEP1GSC036_0595 [Leptospira weilii str. 2006001853]
MRQIAARYIIHLFIFFELLFYCFFNFEFFYYSTSLNESQSMQKKSKLISQNPDS